MAEKSFPFNSVSGDRKYSATDWAMYFGAVLTNGVFPHGDELLVEAAGGMGLTVSGGMGCINGYWYANTAEKTLTCAAADGVLHRYDRVVLRWSRVDRTIVLAIKQGTPASTATVPTLQRDADVWELAIADIYLAGGTSAITQAMITDKRADETVCGIVSSLITPETGGWFAQFDAMFNTWFDGIQGVLSGDVAANLANQIAALQTQTANLIARLGAASWSIAPSDWVDSNSAARSEATISDQRITANTGVTIILDDGFKDEYAVFALDPVEGSVTLCIDIPPAETITGRILIDGVRV